MIFLIGFRSDMSGDKALAVESHCRERGLACVRFDYSGHGESSGAFADGTISGWADDALAVLDALTEGPQILIGSSMGGWIMLLVALARPDRIAGLLGLAAAPDFTQDLIWPALTRAQRTRLTAAGGVELPSAYSDEPHLITRALIDDGRRHMVLRNPIPFDGPVRLLHGLKDPDVPWPTALRLQEKLTGADVEVTLVKDGDHRLSRPSDLARLRRTLDELAAAVASSPGRRVL